MQNAKHDPKVVPTIIIGPPGPVVMACPVALAEEAAFAASLADFGRRRGLVSARMPDGSVRIGPRPAPPEALDVQDLAHWPGLRT